ncbi:unnamed protein product [Lupinus luteus]|uniref:Plant PDR ABC transporter associated domain-containing protein n=1 Tax=Lupinus luteus TaxID=3873 RepID=A0AAV1WFM9_LUPLU
MGLLGLPHDVPPNSSQSLALQVLKVGGFFPDAYWYWIGIGACIGYMLLFNFLFPFALQYLNPFDKPQALISEEALAEKIQLGKIISLNYKGNESRRNVSSRTLSARVGSFSAVHHKRSKGWFFLSHPFLSLLMKSDMQWTCHRKSQGFPDDQLELLKGVNGAFRPGVLTALMSVTGAGKTTLMDVLSGRKTTVYESLVYYSAWLRLPPEVYSSTRQLQLSLLPFANPSIIFMDEPTSDLDARAAAIVMRTVRNTVDTGRTVVYTIHQPSIDIFDAFDEV